MDWHASSIVELRKKASQQHLTNQQQPPISLRSSFFIFFLLLKSVSSALFFCLLRSKALISFYSKRLCDLFHAEFILPRYPIPIKGCFYLLGFVNIRKSEIRGMLTLLTADLRPLLVHVHADIKKKLRRLTEKKNKKKGAKQSALLSLSILLFICHFLYLRSFLFLNATPIRRRTLAVVIFFTIDDDNNSILTNHFLLKSL